MTSLKFYQLDEKGLEQMGYLKKQKAFNTLKYSLGGTAFGFVGSLLTEKLMKKFDSRTVDFTKTAVFLVCLGLISFQGFRVADYEFKVSQKKLLEQHGKEVVSDDI